MAIKLTEQWDADMFEDVSTEIIVQYDSNDGAKPIYIEVNDVKGEEIYESICIALTKEQTNKLIQHLSLLVLQGGQ